MVTTRQLLLKAIEVHMLEIKLLKFIYDLGVPFSFVLTTCFQLLAIEQIPQRGTHKG
jgi:hypothetical protein